ncbi:MAG: DUF4062 domain-containing protein [Synergistaceae bacterium]|nr:DUF4062 domain-containing protein [Synergistaceae bacterium]
MIRLKVFISSVQKEMRSERIAIGAFLSTDDFLRECTVPRIFEEYPQPLFPNPKAYLDLLRQCQIYLLLVGSQYGIDAGDGLSATHEEYRLAQELKLPTLICIKGARRVKREQAVNAFLKEIETAKHTYSRFENEAQLLDIVGKRLREHIEITYSTVPLKAQIEQSALTHQSASEFERGMLDAMTYEDLDPELMLDLTASAEERDKERILADEIPRLLLSRGYLWKDVDTLRPTVAGALLLARKPGMALPQARVQMDAFPGTDRNAEALDSEIFDAPLSKAVERAVAFIRRNTPKPLIVKGLKRVKTETYPAEVLREVVVNAVAHREYSDRGIKISIEVFADRLVVSSPGLPPGGQSVGILSSGHARPRARNPLVVQGLSWLELMDERGSGIPRMARILEQAGHPAPLFRIDHDCLVVEIRPATDRGSESSSETAVKKERNGVEQSTRDVILEEVRSSGRITTRICVQRLGIPRTTAKRFLTDLVKEGLLIIEGSGSMTSYRPSGPMVGQ